MSFFFFDDVTCSNQVIGAGLTVSAIVTMLGATGFIEFLNWAIPNAVVRGLQLGLGLKMIQGGLKLIEPLPWVSQVDCKLLSCVCVLLILLTHAVPKWRNVFPVALVLTIVGFIVAGITMHQRSIEFVFPIGWPVFIAVDTLTWTDILDGFLQAGLAQLPLTTLNSVVSVVELNNRLFKDDDKKHLTRRSVAFSVGLMNLTGLWFGANPSCHGAGGLAGQYQFGARGGTSVIFLGVCKIIMSIFMCNVAAELLAAFPVGVLGSLLMFAGLGLGTSGVSGMNGGIDEVNIWPTVLSTTAITLLLGTGWGFVGGLVVSIFYGLMDHVWKEFATRVLKTSQPSLIINEDTVAEI